MKKEYYLINKDFADLLKFNRQSNFLPRVSNCIFTKDEPVTIVESTWDKIRDGYNYFSKGHQGLWAEEVVINQREDLEELNYQDNIFLMLRYVYGATKESSVASYIGLYSEKENTNPIELFDKLSAENTRSIEQWQNIGKELEKYYQQNYKDFVEFSKEI